MSNLMDFKKKNEELVYEHYLQHALTEKICEIMNKKDISQTELAKRMKVTKSEVCRLLGEGRNLSVRSLAKMFHALGEELEIITKAEYSHNLSKYNHTNVEYVTQKTKVVAAKVNHSGIFVGAIEELYNFKVKGL